MYISPIKTNQTRNWTTKKKKTEPGLRSFCCTLNQMQSFNKSKIYALMLQMYVLMDGQCFSRCTGELNDLTLKLFFRCGKQDCTTYFLDLTTRSTMRVE